MGGARGGARSHGRVGTRSSDDDTDDDAPPVAAMARASVADEPAETKPSGGMTKAMKRRVKKEAEERERDARIAEEKSHAGPSAGEVEAGRLRAALAPLGLKIAQIKADGHCLYRSIAHQLALKPVPGDAPLDHASLRRACAEVMRADERDYRPFLPECAESSDAGTRRGPRTSTSPNTPRRGGGNSSSGRWPRRRGGAWRCTSRARRRSAWGRRIAARDRP